MAYKKLVINSCYSRQLAWRLLFFIWDKDPVVWRFLNGILFIDFQQLTGNLKFNFQKLRLKLKRINRELKQFATTLNIRDQFLGAWKRKHVRDYYLFSTRNKTLENLYRAILWACFRDIDLASIFVPSGYDN